MTPTLRRLLVPAAALAVAGFCMPVPASADEVVEEMAPTTQPADAGGVVEVDQSSPKATAKSLARAAAAGDNGAIISLLHVEEESVKEMFDIMAPMLSSTMRLDVAMREQFGEGMSDEAGMSMPTMEAIDNAELTEEGDTATLAVEGQPTAMELVRVDGKWFIDMSGDFEAMPPQQLDMMKRMLPVMSRVIDEVTQGVNDGDYETAQEAEGDLQNKLQAAMMEAMMQGMGE
jgi:hypothetical protein